MDRILFVGEIARHAREIVKPGNAHCEIVADGNEKAVLDALHASVFDAVVVDGTRDGAGTPGLISRIASAAGPTLPLIAISSRYDAAAATDALTAGAWAFLPASAPPEFLGERLRQVLIHSAHSRDHRRWRDDELHGHPPFIVASDAMREVCVEIARLATLDYDLLLLGETGVGKDMVAREIHRQSHRREKPFVPIPLRSLSESLIESELFGHERGAFSSADRAKIGRFEAADEGTIYIPEISCLNEAIQLKLLYFMQYKRTSRVGHDPRRPELKLDVRVIMASNENLEKLLEQGRLREDFYHRIAGVQVYIPPLRERREDIAPLAGAFLAMFSGAPRGVRYDFSSEALELMQRYHWPGNVRQLENAVKAAIAYARGPVIDVRDLDHVLHIADLHPATTPSHSPSFQPPLYADAFRVFQKVYFTQLMQTSKGNVAYASRHSGLTPQWIRRILKVLEIR